VIAVVAVISFKLFKTTIHPSDPTKTTTLVTHGIYRYSRNPMYVSLVLLLLSWSCFLGSWFGPLAMIAFVAYIETFQIKPEEQCLNIKFGNEYEEYCRKVRRWV
jgi:protein-S-isoprenylcysteine O-methyltransferase Ste14